jgi:two-component system nitrogen regulation sensor histidine kinase NtrY
MPVLPSFTIPPGKDGTRTRRYILATIVILVLALVTTQTFLHRTSVGSPRFVSMTFLLWAATVAVGLALLLLATVLGRNLIKLFFEHKSGQVGSRFKTKMVSTFVVLSLLPAVLLFFLSYGLINVSIKQWFSAPAAQMMENSKAIATQYYQESRLQALRSAANIASALRAADMQPGRAVLAGKLEEARRLYGLEEVRLLDENGNLVADAGRGISTLSQRAWVHRLIGDALSGTPGYQVDRVDPSDALKEVACSAAPMRDGGGKIVGVVLTESINSQGMNFKSFSVTEAYDVYERLKREQAPLRFNFLLILALSTLLIVFAFSWFALYLAKRITVPIQALAEGAAAVAVGDLDHRVVCEAFDELASLVASFNRMTGDLSENKTRIEAAQDSLLRTNVELDDRRRYIETILQTIATGVISLDGNYRVHTMNPAAIQMLEVEGFQPQASLEEVVRGEAGQTLRALLHKSAVLGPMARNIELQLTGKSLHLAATVTPLIDASGQRTGWVMVLDDISELLRAEKMAAWQEVARRLAHEIKNPLTPIQLSAERVLRRYKQLQPTPADGSLPAIFGSADFTAFDGLLEDCVHTIIQEANSLKNLVDEFSRFARLPEARLEEADLHKILENTLNLYQGRVHDIRLVRNFGTDVPLLRLDPEQMKRVFINLFDNALEAMADNAQPKILQIRTDCSRLKHRVRIEICDTGRGFPKEYQDSLFLPYFSTRKGGTGLGLAIVRQIISDHHGYVRAEPNQPLGTKIVIDLPLAAA